MREVIITSFYKDLTRKAAFSKGWSWLKFNNLGLTLGTKLRFYTSVRKGLKLRVREFCGLIPTFVGVTGEKLVRGGGGDFLLASPPLSISSVILLVARIRPMVKHHKVTKYYDQACRISE